MGIVLNAFKDRKDLPEIQKYLYQDALTLNEGIIDVQMGFKSGANVHESRVSVSMKAGTSAGVSTDGTINLAFQRTPVALTLIEYSDTIDEEILKGTMFEDTMPAGAMQNGSTEFDRQVLSEVIPAIGEDLDSKIWNGATLATKTAIAALTPGVGQGLISASAQALVASMPTTLFDSIPVRMLYNNSLSKVIPGAGLGNYLKVVGTTVTESNIAAEFAKIYNRIPSKIINKKSQEKYIFANFEDYQLIVAANKLATVSQQMPFVIQNPGQPNEIVSFNGIIIKFYPLVGFRFFAIPKHIKLLGDLAGDQSSLEIDRMANGSKMRYIKNQQMLTTWVTNQDLNVLYNG